MSETIRDVRGDDGGAGALDSHGQTTKRAATSADPTVRGIDNALDQFGYYVRHQPFSTALLALGIGYLIGRLRLV